MTSPLTTDAGVGCPACESRVARLLGTKLNHVLWDCGQCGTIFVPVGGRAPVSSLYDAFYEQAPFKTPPSALVSLERLVQSSARYRKTGQWLDVGYGEGALLTVAERHGWACFGTEISPPVLEYGHQRGWTVTADPFDDPRFSESAFDVVTMIELLEHVPDPRRLLKDAARWLRPDGLLYVTTPNARSLNFRLLGLGWSVVSPPDHLMLWTARGLQYALASAGFRDLRIRSEGFNPVELLARKRRNDADAEPFDRNASARALSESLSKTRGRRCFKRVVNAGLNTLGLGDTLKVWAVRDG